VGGFEITEKKNAKLTFQETGLRIKSTENGSKLNQLTMLNSGLCRAVEEHLLLD